MAMPQTIETYRHPFADGGFKRMLINGEWVRAASGKSFQSLNPSTGEVLATVAEGDKEDIDRAVTAALRGSLVKVQALRATGVAAQNR
jgi:aldehyde dehydrogenase (NAD+)